MPSLEGTCDQCSRTFPRGTVEDTTCWRCKQAVKVEAALREYTDEDTCQCTDEGHHDCLWCRSMELLGEDNRNI